MAPTRQVVSCSRVLFNSISSASRPKTPTRSNITTKQPCLASSFHTSSTVNRAQRTLDSQTISEITQKESEITHQSEPVKGGPTAQAQKHANEAISNPNVVSDIVKGETNITQNDAPIAGGPAAKVMSEAAQAGNEVRHISPTCRPRAKLRNEKRPTDSASSPPTTRLVPLGVPFGAGRRTRARWTRGRFLASRARRRSFRAGPSPRGADPRRRPRGTPASPSAPRICTTSPRARRRSRAGRGSVGARRPRPRASSPRAGREKPQVGAA